MALSIGKGFILLFFFILEIKMNLFKKLLIFNIKYSNNADASKLSERISRIDKSITFWFNKVFFNLIII